MAHKRKEFVVTYEERWFPPDVPVRPKGTVVLRAFSKPNAKARFMKRFGGQAFVIGIRPARNTDWD